MRRRVLLVTGLLMLFGAGAVAVFLPQIRSTYRKVSSSTSLGFHPLKPDPKTYSTLKKDLARWHKDLSGRYANARTAEQKTQVEHDARVALEYFLPAMMHCWLGTPWDFNGTAPAPGQGKIACGYFVSTVLTDAGFRVSRTTLAQQPSSRIILTFVDKGQTQLTVGEDYSAFANRIEQCEPGIYVVGLDTHVAFLVLKGGKFRFVHSSGSKPWCVVDEPRSAAKVLQRSKWRMVANLTADSELIRRWLRSEKLSIPTP